MSTNNIYIGIRNGKEIPISQVSNGLACDCVCAYCKEPLIAKKGNIRIHHFAHYKNQDCNYALETELHKRAKEILEIAKVIVLPEVVMKIGQINVKIKDSFNKYDIDTVEVEHKTGHIIPDVVICFKNKKKMLFIEIKVTHGIDSKKKEKIDLLGISTIEINLSKYKRNKLDEELKRILLEVPDHKEWILNSKVYDIQKEIKKLKPEEKIVENKFLDTKVSCCPISARRSEDQGFAWFQYDCKKCLYCLNYSIKDDNYLIQCIGNNKSDVDEIMNKHKLEEIIDNADHLEKKPDFSSELRELNSELGKYGPIKSFNENNGLYKCKLCGKMTKKWIIREKQTCVCKECYNK
jgi:hypothetical protein